LVNSIGTFGQELGAPVRYTRSIKQFPSGYEIIREHILQKIDDIMNNSLFFYNTTGNAALFGRGEEKLPMILSGNFDVNFALDRNQNH